MKKPGFKRTIGYLICKYPELKRWGKAGNPNDRRANQRSQRNKYSQRPKKSYRQEGRFAKLRAFKFKFDIQPA